MSATVEAIPKDSVPAASVAPPVARTLEYFPVSLFGSVMSLTVLSGAWRLAQIDLDAPGWIAVALGDLSIVAFVVITACYLTKCFTAPDAVRKEFLHPIVGNLFGTIFISLLLQPIVLVQWSPFLARAMWTVGAIGMTVFAWLMVTRWLTHRQQTAHATPAWIVPVVGMLDLPLALPSLGLSDLHEVMVMALAVGLFFAIPLFTMIVMRLVFEEPLPNALAPSLLILPAPFAVGVSAYFVTVGQLDLFAQALYALNVFILAAVFGRLRYLVGCCPFRVSWWAVGFPLAASAIAGLRFARADPNWVNSALAIGLLIIATSVILALVVRTLIGVFDGELRALSS